MQFNAATFTAILAATAMAAPSLQKRGAIADIVSEVLGWCNAHGNICNKVCSVGMSELAGESIPFAGALIGPIWCADMAASVKCAFNPADEFCENIGKAILNQSAAALGWSQAQWDAIKGDASSIGDLIAEEAKKVQSWACEFLHIGC